jgi:hypothetical protein
MNILKVGLFGFLYFYDVFIMQRIFQQEYISVSIKGITSGKPSKSLPLIAQITLSLVSETAENVSIVENS